jgi:hypothetical protein
MSLSTARSPWPRACRFTSVAGLYHSVTSVLHKRTCCCVRALRILYLHYMFCDLRAMLARSTELIVSGSCFTIGVLHERSTPMAHFGTSLLCYKHNYDVLKLPVWSVHGFGSCCTRSKWSPCLQIQACPTLQVLMLNSHDYPSLVKLRN